MHTKVHRLRRVLIQQAEMVVKPILQRGKHVRAVYNIERLYCKYIFTLFQIYRISQFPITVKAFSNMV